MEFKFDLEENKEKIKGFENFIEDNKNKEGSLIPVLQKAQADFGYLPVEILEIVSKGLKIPLAEIYGVATFYSQFSFIPKGEFEVGICLGTACYVKGGQKILDKVEEELGIKSGETTADMKFSINSTRCIGECSLAPVISINGHIYGELGPEDIKEILDKYR